MKPQDQIMCALIKPVKFLKQVFKIEAGIHGVKLLAVLLMLIITSIIVFQISFAEYISILYHLMGQHQI